MVSAGMNHTVVSTDRSEVFSFGASEYGQLGHGDTDTCNYPVVVEKLLGMGHGIDQIGCGAHHTIVLLGSGEVCPLQ